MSDIRQVSATVAICLGTFMSTLDISIVNVALPAIQKTFNSNMSDLQWVIDAYALCLSVLILSSGQLSDMTGRKRIWMSGVIFFTIGSVLCSVAPSMDYLLGGRVIQGIGAAALIPGALSLITHEFPDLNTRIKIIGIWSSVNAVSLVTGPVLGGIIVNATDWSFIFMINIPVGIIVLLLGGWSIRESKGNVSAADPIGQLLSVIVLGTLTWGFILTGKYGWNDYRIIILFVISLLSSGVFIITEMKVSNPLFPLSMFRSLRFSLFNLASFILGFSSYTSVFFISLYLQQACGWDAWQTGWGIAPEFLAMAAFSVVFGRLSMKFRIINLLTAGNCMLACSLLLLSVATGYGSSYTVIALLLIPLGAGTGLIVPAVSALIMNSAPDNLSGTASSIMNALRQTGMTVGIALLGSLMNMATLELLSDGLQRKELTDIQQIIGEFTEHPDIGGIQQFIYHAFSWGFSVAMFWAGIACSLMTLILIMQRRKLTANLHHHTVKPDNDARK
ncbi:MFS transporter [Salmonella enterica]|nr:DHA2 family efflux MFS transporter permease subunit [Salmonella enterica]EBS3849508.1 MFS transporter [Salmonella enterica subsp. enterica serovar Java]EDX3986944.1 MFS transporter [Salmonella enterica subsp. enterica serovar 4,[5],12:b:-]EEE5612340.1 DHA2 family efflux MFS transporter permease subunit [Salmonella enterica subsp. enterica serovar Typhimurium]EKN5803780.1 MFS transporter [Salmonella enterica subsp. enterica]